ncbi:hypothetical protein ACWA1C_12750 [Flectobacillus roseus]
MKNKNLFYTVLSILVAITIAYFIVLLYGFNIISFDEKEIVISHHNFKLNQAFKDSGTTGDTIGGIFGPIISIIASILTYWALMEQVTANEIQIKAQRKDEFESRAFQLLSLSNEKRKSLSEIDTKFDFFENFFDHFNINFKVYCGSHVGEKYSESTAYYFRRKFKRGVYGEPKTSFDTMIFYVVIPIMHGIKSSRFPLNKKNGYVAEIKGYYTDQNNTERKFDVKPTDDYTKVKTPLVAKVLKIEHLKYGFYNDMSSHINSIKLILEFIYGAKNEKIISSSDADFFYRLVLNEMSIYEQLFFFLLFITYQETDLFITSDLVRDSKLFESLNYDILKEMLTDNFLRFKTVEDYLNGKFDILPAY